MSVLKSKHFPYLPTIEECQACAYVKHCDGTICVHDDNQRMKKIGAYKGGRLCDVYLSIKSASESVGVSKQALTQALCGVTKTAGGYQWKYL